MSRMIATFKIYISYSQFFIFEDINSIPAYDWTQAHSEQGFARSERGVSFGTLLEFGNAMVSVRLGKFVDDERFERVVSVPFHVSGNEVTVCGPEEVAESERTAMPAGNYRVVAAQSLVDDAEDIVITFEQIAEGHNRSEILRADSGLRPPRNLVETADPVNL